mgnify:CR=1 FL=1
MNWSALVLPKKQIMKIILGTLFILISTLSISQKPQKVYSIVMERRELSWYEEQEELWKKEIEKNLNNTDAWFYYYEAVRAQYNLTPWSDESKETFKPKLDSITTKAYEYNPDTFEGNFMMYRNFGNLAVGGSDGYFKYLEKAYELDPYDSRSYDLFAVHYEIQREVEKFQEFCIKFYNSNEIAGFIYNWAYNLLSGLDENAILFLGGDNDTFSCWALQNAKKIRPDVHLLNTSLLTVDDYRISIFKELEIEQFEGRLDSCKTNEEWGDKWNQIFDHFFKNNKGYPVYVSTTCIQQFEDEFGDSLYLTGLAYKYSDESFDNISIIRRNYENRYLMDYLDIQFGFHIQNGKIDQLNATYLPSMLKLYQHYKDCEDQFKMSELKPKIVDISKKIGQYEDVKDIVE